MSNAQLYLAMAIPSAIAFLGIVTSLITFFISNQGFNKRVDGTDRRLDAVDRRLDRMQDSIDLIQRDHRDFYAKQDVHDAEIANLKARAQ